MLQDCPLIVSAQAAERSSMEDPETLRRLAQASVDQGVEVIRLQGADNIRHIKDKVGVPVIGLIKKNFPGSSIYITPTEQEVKRLLALGCEIIALDASTAPRPDGSTFDDLVALIQKNGRLAMADCDSEESVDHAVRCHVDLIGTTLAGYTSARPMTEGPDFDLVRYAVGTGKAVIAEGRYAQRWQIEVALRIGAKAVVVGGAINDPVKQTKALMPKSRSCERVGAVDLGGTWIRFGVFENGELVSVEKVERPSDRDARVDWVRSQVLTSKVTRIGIGTGGTVDPLSGEVWEAKEIIPSHCGTVLNSEVFGVPTVALNDGLATAWGHACHPRFAGRRVATLALGTGVGAGLVSEGKIFCGRRGEYLRINDLYLPSGRTVEDVLGGAALDGEGNEAAVSAFKFAVQYLRSNYFPDVIVVCGGVGFADWLRPHLLESGCELSPYEDEAGLYGAYHLAYY